MINRKQKFREIISDKDYTEALDNATLSSLGHWYAELLDKIPIEISNFDIIRCIRQNIFLDEAIHESIQRMKENGTALYAEDDCIELISKLASVKKENLLPYKDEIEQIIKNMDKENLIEKYEIWMYEEEKDEFRNNINKIKDKVSFKHSM